jgi:hypothetical protein
MAFAELAEIGIVDFVERHRRRNSPWGFIHVPKTAGTSLSAVLTAKCGPHRKIFPKSYLVSPEEFRALEWDAVNEFVALQSKDAMYKSFSGHLKRRHTDVIRVAFPEMRFFSILRDPVSRVISEYRYSLTPNHPPHEEFARRYPTLLDYALGAENRNLMTKYLGPGGNMAKITAEDAIRSVTTYYEFLGVSEMYAMSASVIFRMMGLVHLPRERMNVTTDSERNAIAVDADAREQIRKANHLDVAIYRYVYDVLAPQSETWSKHFEALRQG